MNKNTDYYIDFNSKIEKMLQRAEFLGSGHNGIVYLLDNKKVIKIFKDKKVCKKEFTILRRTRKSNYFPKVYNHGAYYIIRDYVSGQRLDKYIKKHGFNIQIALNIIELINEFKRLNFNKLDIRCKDLYVGKDFSLTVIDPKNNYSKEVIYPRHLMKGLNKLGVLDEFLETVKEQSPKTYELWNYRIEQYFGKGIK
ncbi:protein kinase [Clostridium sp. ZS2-4]|uniref:protein kinase n=1 Tax=Clostridium sp. ZS2-4 TaxID=2987703 RepID=UPI00227B9C9D|nr:protein kinase [Clostridium sp. ZS2-4]MCY6354995.1 protein kinase [Clostridium sp. ZS2-4]